jgi:predicted dehydrogenase
MSLPSIALVGCGAIAEAFYIPALERSPDLVRSLVLVDRDLGRAEAIRARMGAARAVSDYRNILDQVRGAIVAVPHHLHTPLTLDFVSHGVHVLSEKPLSETAAEVDQVIEAASKNEVHVVVNHTRRLFTSFQEVQRLTTRGSIGDLREIDYALGDVFGWPAETNTYFGTAAGGRGVLFDTGAHIVDLVCWFMGGKPELVNYSDDARGGTEAVAELTVRRGSATAHIHLSWLSKLRNTYIVRGTEATLEGRVYESSTFTRRNRNGRARTIRTDKAREFTHFAEKLIENFVDCIEGRASPIVSALDVRPSVALIEECYAQRSPSASDRPWFDACERLAHV